MTTYLLDVNVLVSLAWPNHVHHVAARRWFRDCGSSSWATTPVTESGFVRVSSNRAAIPSAVSPGEAAELLRRMRAHPGHRFVPDDVELVIGAGAASWTEVATHRLVTDCHLLTLARQYGLVLATFDRGAGALEGLGDSEVIGTEGPW